MISRNFCKKYGESKSTLSTLWFYMLLLSIFRQNKFSWRFQFLMNYHLACFIVPNFCHRFHGGSMCIFRNWFDGKFMMLHDAAAIFKKSLGRETGFFLTVQFISCTFFVTTCPLLQYSIFNALHFVEAMYGWWGTLMYPKSWAWVMTVHLEQFEL